MRFKAADRDLPAIAGELGVRYVLEGSVRRAGSRLRVTAQLIDAGDGRHLWSERYEREMTDVFAIQDEIGEAISTALRVRLGAEFGEGLREFVLDADQVDHQPGLIIFSGRTHWSNSSFVR